MPVDHAGTLRERWRIAGLPPWRFVLRWGIAGFGLAFGVVFSILMYWCSADWANHAVWEKVVASLAIILILGPLVGLAWSMSVWKAMEMRKPGSMKRYDAPASDA